MKKILLLLFITTSFFSYSDDSFPFIKTGEYAIYHDTRGSLDFHRAFFSQRISDGSVIISVNNRNNINNEVKSYMIVIEEKENNTPEVLNVYGYSKDDSPQVTQVISDTMNFLMFYARNENKITLINKIEDPWETYTQIYDYNILLPIFKFNKMYIKDEPNKGGYKLLSFGKFENSKEFDFTKFPFDDEIVLKQQQFSNLKSNEEKKVNLYNYALTIDDNWVKNNELGFPGYWVKNHSFRDSQVMLEKAKWDDITSMGITNINEFISRTIYHKNNRVIANSLETIKDKNHTKINYYSIDENNYKNITKMDLWIEDDYLYIFNFSSFSDIYDNNLEYYENILESFTME